MPLLIRPELAGRFVYTSGRSGQFTPTDPMPLGTEYELTLRPGLRRGDRMRITAGPFENHLAIYDGMKSRERVAVLLAMLGSVQRVELPKCDIERLTG